MILEVQALESGYGKKQVLFGAELSVSAGEIVGIIGPNGSGKSTLLKSIFGITRPWAGEIRLGDASIASWSPLKKMRAGLGLVVQGGQAFGDLSVSDNLMLGGQVLLGRAELHRRVEALKDRFPILRERGGEHASRLSGGERQQLALARSLVCEPSVLLLDEPSLGLSPALVQQSFSRLADLRAEGMTLVIVEQNVRAVLDIADRLLIVREGAIAAEAATSDFLAREDLVETFLGSEWATDHHDAPATG